MCRCNRDFVYFSTGHMWPKLVNRACHGLMFGLVFRDNTISFELESKYLIVLNSI